MLGDPLLDFAQWTSLGELGSELRAELRLPAWPAQEHHQVSGHHERDVASQIFVN